MKIPPIQQAYENIKDACDKKFKKLYAKGIPEEIQNRYEQELSFLKKSDVIDDFEIFRLLSAEAKKCSSYFIMRGTVTGSLLYYLLGNLCFNPLPVHYYCPDCGHFEPVKTHRFGIDLPEKKCKICGRKILADGFNLPLESVWGTDGKKVISFDYNISKDFLPFARRVLLALYPDNQVVPTGMFFKEREQTSHIKISPTGFAVLPGGRTLEDYPDLLAYLEDGEPCLSGGSWELSNHYIKSVTLLPMTLVTNLITLQQKTGIYIESIRLPELRNITWRNIFNAMVLSHTEEVLYNTLKPKTMTEMVSFHSCAHSTFSQIERDTDCNTNPYGIMQLMETEEFLRYPCCTREDFFDYLLEDGIERSEAFLFSECIRKGWSNSVKHQTDYEAFAIPEELKEIGRKYRYIFPRAHCVEYMMLFARMAYYCDADSRIFRKVITKE